jgi:hypothetical protein
VVLGRRAGAAAAVPLADVLPAAVQALKRG